MLEKEKSNIERSLQARKQKLEDDLSNLTEEKTKKEKELSDMNVNMREFMSTLNTEFKRLMKCG